jgi:hypothetical protein
MVGSLPRCLVEWKALQGGHGRSEGALPHLKPPQLKTGLESGPKFVRWQLFMIRALRRLSCEWGSR